MSMYRYFILFFILLRPSIGGAVIFQDSAAIKPRILWEKTFHGINSTDSSYIRPSFLLNSGMEYYIGGSILTNGAILKFDDNRTEQWRNYLTVPYDSTIF